MTLQQLEETLAEVGRYAFRRGLERAPAPGVVHGSEEWQVDCMEVTLQKHYCEIKQ